MADIKTAYNTTNTALTITLAALADSAARSSASVSNATNLFLDAMLTVKVQNGATTGTDQAVYVYAYGSDDSTLFAFPSSGSDAAILTTPTNLPLLKVIDFKNPPFTNTDITVVVGSVASAFGGVLPNYWGVVIDNRTGAALVNTAANHMVRYTGIYATSS